MEKWFFSFKIHASGLFECLWKLALVRLHSKVMLHQGIYPRQNVPTSDTKNQKLVEMLTNQKAMTPTHILYVPMRTIMLETLQLIT